jgi:hypothetical protein
LSKADGPPDWINVLLTVVEFPAIAVNELFEIWTVV